MQIIKVDSEKCLKCNRCIASCPEQFASFYNGDELLIDPAMCIGCGACIQACTHEARVFVDDTDKAFIDIKTGIPTIVFMAPATAGYFDVKQLTGFFKREGVSAVFDVSYGAELTTESYIQHIEKNTPELLIAQPCPVVVNYIEKNKPELLPFLAPIHSPMMQTIEWVKQNRPDLKDHQFIMISPCIAKQEEFRECDENVHLVTIKGLETYLQANQINIHQYPPMDLDSLDFERGAIYPVPGGLKASVVRKKPQLGRSIKTLEGPDRIFKFLDSIDINNLQEIPFTVLDILHCQHGCAEGSGVPEAKNPEFKIMTRPEIKKLDNPLAVRSFHKKLKEQLKSMSVHRSYEDKSKNISIQQPSELDLAYIYGSLKKTKKEDFLNCNSCGYKDCESMAIAIHNGRNTADNCIFFRAALFEEERDVKKATIDRLSGQVTTLNGTVEKVVSDLSGFVSKVQKQLHSLSEMANNTRQTVAAFTDLKHKIESCLHSADNMKNNAQRGATEMKSNVSQIHKAAEEADGIQKLIKVLDDIAHKTNILSINASIEAANSGHQNSGFKVVAGEIRNLAGDTFTHIENMSEILTRSIQKMKDSQNAGDSSYNSFVNIAQEISKMNDIFGGLGAAALQLEKQTRELEDQLAEVTDIAAEVQKESDATQGTVNDVFLQLKSLFAND